jgi:hypothetical protein
MFYAQLLRHDILEVEKCVNDVIKKWPQTAYCA